MFSLAVPEYLCPSQIALHKSDFLYAVRSYDSICYENANIFAKQVAAVYLAIDRWCHSWSNHHVIFHVDNQGMLRALCSGQSNHGRANSLIHKILWVAALYHISLQFEYVGSADNVVLMVYHVYISYKIFACIC